MSNIFLRKWQRSTCPMCGYPKSYSESTRSDGLRVSKCWSCSGNDSAFSHLRTSDNGTTRAANIAAEAHTAKAREKAQERARVIWSGAEPVIANDPAGRYLIRRVLAHLIGTKALRYRADVPHPSGSRCLAMVALVQSATGEPLGIHRTYLTPDGQKAGVDPMKASLGPIWGGAIRLAPAAPDIVIGEGIETSASAGLLLKLPAWAAISAGNMAKGLVLPTEVRRVIIAADHDQPGLDAAEAAATRWQAEGRKVRIIKPSKPGLDFNDVLQAREAGKVAQ